MKKQIRITAAILTLAMLFSGIAILSGCKNEEVKEGYQVNTELDTTKEVKLRIASSQKAWAEMDTVIAQFENIYQNCSIVCEYIEDYTDNLLTRLNQDEQKIDIFKTNAIQPTTPYKDNALNLISEESAKYLDLSGTNKGIVDNYRYTGAENTQYAIPYGGEMRGMYVNVTLLQQFGLSVPTNRAELMNCCKVLYENGYIPMQSGIGSFGQQLLYPYICNSIVNGGNYEEVYAAIENIDDGISEYFRDAYSFLYEIVEKGYYDYKRVETELGYHFSSNEDKAREFLNIASTGDDTYEKVDDIGKIAFITDTQAFELYLERTKADYHSEIEYKFILSPVGEDGGYAYLSPSEGLAINNASDNKEWALEFLNFFFTPEINKVFAEETGKIPNTAGALLQYDVPADRTCDVGQVTFSYGFYKVLTIPMLEGHEDMIGISKMNAKKYMKDNGDGTYSLLFTLEDYLDRLEAEFQKVKASRLEGENG